MACINCKEKCKTNVRHVCRVCELVDGDTTKKKVCWCEDCQAYICKSCFGDLPRRAIAFTKNAVEKIVVALKGTRRKKKDEDTPAAIA